MDEYVIDDMLHVILQFLDTITLCRCRVVNRRWRRITLIQCTPITWRGKYRERCRKGDMLSITYDTATQYKDISFIGDAARSGSLDVILYFGIPSRDLDEKYDIMYNAVQSGNITLVKYLLRCYALDESKALRYAAIQGNLKMVKILCKQAVQTGCKDRVAIQMAANEACSGGHIRTAKYLMGSLRFTNVNYKFFNCCMGGLTRLIKRIQIPHIDWNVWIDVGIVGTQQFIDYMSEGRNIHYRYLIQGLARSGNLHLLEKYHKYDNRYVDTELMEYGILCDNIDIVRYLVDHSDFTCVDIHRCIIRYMDESNVELCRYILAAALYKLELEEIINIGIHASVLDYCHIVQLGWDRIFESYHPRDSGPMKYLTSCRKKAEKNKSYAALRLLEQLTNEYKGYTDDVS
jgi:hypothetical protein